MASKDGSDEVGFFVSLSSLRVVCRNLMNDTILQAKFITIVSCMYTDEAFEPKHEFPVLYSSYTEIC